MTKVVSHSEAVKSITDGMSIMVGGFMTVGTAEGLIDALVEKGVKDLTIICNDAGYENKGVGKLIKNGQVKKLITSHIGLNPLAGKLMSEGTLEVVLTPQGTLIEQIRSGGAGLGGVLTPTGLGTLVEEGKQIIEVDGKKYLLEKPLKADVSIIYGSVIDKIGNINFNYTTNNFNQQMAMAGALVIAEGMKIVEPTEIPVDNVKIPSIFVDYVVDGGAR